MRNRHLLLIVMLVVSLLLTGCWGTLEIGIESGSPTVTVEVADLDVTSTPISATSDAPNLTAVQPTWTATSTPEPSATPTANPTWTPKPPPTATPVPTSTSAPPRPQISTFTVGPGEVWPGDAVTLTWEAKGDRATVCPSARYILFTSDDCWPVPLSGTTEFTIPLAAASFQRVDFTLTVETIAPAATVTGQASVALWCASTWYFTEEPQAGVCPLEAIHSYAASQHFQQGTMIWLEEPGRYYILQDAPLYEDAERNRVDIISDPLDINRDTSSEFQPPAGLYAPVSGFGLVWRGDVAQSPGFHEQLGWALAPEFGYDAILQCDNAVPSGGRSWQTCYLKGPEGKVFMLHPLGGWQLWGQP
jgi:hypothetical protein